MSQPRPEMACATCLTPLNTVGDTYIHPISTHTSYRHPAVPVAITGLDTVRRTCDFCGDPHPIWTLTGGDLTAVITSNAAKGGLVQNFGDRWATCAPCYQHVVTRRYDRLADRALHALQPLDPAAQQRIIELHHGFLAGLQPGRMLITTTAWPATPVTARDLPKIRDRLTRFHRSPITLPGHLTIDRADLAHRLEQGRLYWVDPTFTKLATTAARSLPTMTLRSDLIPGNTGILAWATPTDDTTAITWTLHDSTVHVIRYRSIGGGLDETILQPLREDVGWLAPITEQTLPLGTQVNPAQQRNAAILATWLLMGQPAAETPAAEIDRPTRKRYARTGQPLPDIRLVRLRTTHPGRSATTRQNPSERATPIDRVWVTGHWRNQAHGPGRSLRRPVYIHPHLRGPDDAPIKLSTTVRVLSTSENNEQRPTT